MLIAVGIVAGLSRLQRFAFFVLAFAIWDLCYYLFLYLLLGWPDSLLTWDILFLIPVPWVGPVWAPCLLCLLMTWGALHIIVKTTENGQYKITTLHWTMMIGGAITCIFSFMWDYLCMRSQQKGSWNIFSQADLFIEIQSYVPGTFNYLLFFTGFIFMCASITLNIYQSNITNNKSRSK
jgi:hypothetical protein